jgi:hypothetical protein
LIGLTAITLNGPYACQLRTHLTFTVQRYYANVSKDSNEGAYVHGLRGARQTVSVDARLQPGTVIVRAWAWRNWCGKSDRRYQLLGVANETWGTYFIANLPPPRCVSRRRQSSVVEIRPPVARCHPDSYKISTGSAQGFEDHIIDTPTVSLRRGFRACVAKVKLSFGVQEETSSGWRFIRRVDENPSRPATFGALIADGPDGNPLFSVWAWFNWCGGPGDFRWLATVDGQSDHSPISTTPYCVDKSQPSTLTEVYDGHQPTRPPK